MHILEIPSFFPPHGGYFCLEQAYALKRRGHEVRILACVRLGMGLDKSFYLTAPYNYRWDKRMGVDVLRHYHRDLPKMTHRNVLSWINEVNKMYEMYIKKFGTPDIIHAHCGNCAGIVATQIGRKTNRPVFITEHISSFLFEQSFGDGWIRHRWLKDMITQAYTDATCVIPVAEELVNDLQPFFGKDYHYTPISNVISTTFFEYKERKNRQDRPFRFCCIGNANGTELVRKGYDVLSKAFYKIPDCELHIAGRNTLCAKIKELFPHHTIIHGELNQAQIRNLLYQCDALVLPSRSEVQPLVVLEALSTGIPVVGSEAIPQSERIHGACLIAKTGDADDLASKMIKCKDIHPSESFSQAVKAIASPEIVAAQLEALFTKHQNTAI